MIIVQFSVYLKSLSGSLSLLHFFRERKHKHQAHREITTQIEGLCVLSQHREKMFANNLPFACEGLKSPIPLASVEKLSATEQK